MKETKILHVRGIEGEDYAALTFEITEKETPCK